MVTCATKYAWLWKVSRENINKKIDAARKSSGSNFEDKIDIQ
jgi:hypothetical protein